jgi:integrase/recombinase XerD
MKTAVEQTGEKKRRSKKEWPKVRETKHKTGARAWLVDARISGKGERYFFKSKAEAETKADHLRTTRANEGTTGLAIPDRLRVDALECAKLLEPFGASLREAVQYFIKHSRPTGGKRALGDMRDEFLRSKTDANRRAEYLRVQRHILNKFCEEFGTRAANEVRADEIGEWLQRQPWSQRTRRNYHADLSNFFGFAMRKGYCAENPLLRLDKPTIDEALPPAIFAVAEAASLLAASEELGGKMTAFVAVGLFAGLRTAELLQLDWRQIDLEARTIEVASSISKTRDHRYVAISDNLAAWLRLHRRESGPLRPAAWRWHRDAARTKAKLAKWPDNGMRHSFGSYHFARHNNAALTAAEMGHRGETRTLFAHYRALVKPKEAERYWKIKPGPKGANIVAFEQAAA